MQPMTNETILKEFLEKVWNQKRKDLVSTYVDDQYTIYLDNGDPWQGRTIDNLEYEKRLDHTFIPFPDIHFDIRSIVSDGDQVAITWIMRGTNFGPIAGFPSTNKSIKTFGSTIYFFRNNKLCGHSQVFDRLTITKQLGFAS
jgi:predicted ester cyclase